MAHLHKKMKKGRPYYYVREMQRIDGKPTVVSQIYLGSVENIAAKFKESAAAGRPVEIRAEEFGSLFIANELERLLGTIEIIDSIVPKGRSAGPSVGEYFYFAWVNRLIDPKSKRALEEWYGRTAVQHLRPVQIELLTSQQYWKKWDRVSEDAIEKIGKAFFHKVWTLQQLPPECVVFDTTNYFTYMASDTESDLCQRGHNKASKHHLRQVGLALLVDRTTQLPLYYRPYEGNRHDSKVFQQVIDEMFGVLLGFNQTKQRLTIVFDKGMNSDENIEAIDDQSRIHFITTYSPYFVEDLATTELKYFAPVAIRSNVAREENGHKDDNVTAYRTKRELWGKERTIVVTHNPVTMRKKRYTLARKLEVVRESLLEFRRNYRDAKPHWRDPDQITERYQRLCERLHIGSQYYKLEFGDRRRAPEMSFRKDDYQIKKTEAVFGRNIIVTDNDDWTTDEIVQLSLDRYFVEKQFRASKAGRHVNINPFFHWTDSKIRCQLLTCVIALTALRILELKIAASGVSTRWKSQSGRAVLEEMRALHSLLLWYPSKKTAERVVEMPTKTQAEVLRAFGWQVSAGGVLQQASV